MKVKLFHALVKHDNTIHSISPLYLSQIPPRRRRTSMAKYQLLTFPPIRRRRSALPTAALPISSSRRTDESNGDAVESIKQLQDSLRESVAGDPIKFGRITLPDGTVKKGKKWESTPLDIAKEISKSLGANALISQVNGVLWDLTRTLEGDCDTKLFTFESDEGRDTFWHSTAHILGQGSKNASLLQ